MHKANEWINKWMNISRSTFKCTLLLCCCYEGRRECQTSLLFYLNQKCQGNECRGPKNRSLHSVDAPPTPLLEHQTTFWSTTASLLVHWAERCRLVLPPYRVQFISQRVSYLLYVNFSSNEDGDDDHLTQAYLSKSGLLLETIDRSS